MDLNKNKKGLLNTLSLIFIVIFSLILMIFLIVMSYSFGLFDDSFSQLTGNIGNVSIQETYENTLQPGIIHMKTTVPQIISSGVLLGMILSLALVGYHSTKKDRLWILIDISIIIIAEILCVLIRKIFIEFIGSSPEFLEISRDILPIGTKFILNLPTLIPTIGIIIMLFTYLLTKKSDEEISF